MTPEDNKKIARRIVIEIIAGNVALIDELFAENYVDHALPPGTTPTRHGFKLVISAMRTAFPDLEYSIEDQVAEGDRVAQRLVARGTMKGELMGMPPTGKSAVWQEMHFFKFKANGKVTEHWDLTDEMGMIAQLGVAPPAGPA